ncbi:hypothetical protein QE152_g41285, partial [Popillia japonica]
MLKHWSTHAEYQQFISVAVSQLNFSQRKKLASYSDSLEKLTSLNLDPVGEHLRPYYSDTGRPALNQPEILRSFVLMMDQGITSLTNWVETLQSDDLLALMIGCTTDSLPPLGSYYDFIDRTWLQDSESQKNGRDDLLRYDKNHKRSNKKGSVKTGSDKKLPNRHPGITK